MNIDVLQKIIIGDLSLELLKLQEDLEILVNSNIETKQKIKKIKKILNKIVNTEASILKFTTLMAEASK